MSPISATPIVSIRNLTFAYGREAPVLSIESLTVQAGEKVFIHGPSGSGKTTLLGLLAGVLAPQIGVIQILGQEFSKLSASRRDRFRGAHLGYIFQMFNLIPYLNVRDNILLSHDLNARRDRKLSHQARAARVSELAQELGIDTLLDRTVTKLSVGQQQRVAAARALLGSPEIIIADEPTSALDYDYREKFIHLLFTECNKAGTTVLFVSHDRQLEPLFDRCISLTEINQAATRAK